MYKTNEELIYELLEHLSDDLVEHYSGERSELGSILAELDTRFNGSAFLNDVRQWQEIERDTFWNARR